MASPPKYVVDSPLDGRYDLGDLIGSQAAEANDASTGDYWPRIPPSYGPPPAHLENTVKEVAYIMLLLQKTTAPDNGSGDVSCVSDLLLNLETREDITKLVLEYTSWDVALRLLSTMKDTPEIDTLNIGPRAAALKKHWYRTTEGPQDVDYPPLLSAAPGKPEGWKLGFTAKGMEEAEKYYHDLKMKREYYYRCFQAKPPRPMGWAPKDGDAWAKTPRDKVESGDLFGSRLWTPIWEGFGLASIGVGIDMLGMPRGERDGYYETPSEVSDMITSFQGRNLQREGILAN